MSRSNPRIPLLYAAPTVPGGRWLLGLAIFIVLLSAFWAAGIFAPTLRQRSGDSYGPALFFTVILAYIVPVFGYISERTVAALEDLRDSLDAQAEQVSAWQRQVYRKPRAWHAWVLAIGAASGAAHNLLLHGSPAALWHNTGASAATAAVAVGTLLTWLVLTVVIAALLDNAFMLARAARHCRVALLHTRRLRPFATIAVISTLALIGAQAAFPIMFIEDDLNPAAFIPGLIATGVPMVMLAALPVWPTHRRIASAKHEALDQVNRQLGALPAPDPAHPATLHAVTPLLIYRREVMQTSEWPFDVGVMARLGLYLIIPPLTWVGAALIENVVNAAL